MSESLQKRIVHRELETDVDEPEVQVANVIADLEGKPTDELAALYDRIDGCLENIFATPPDPEAQVQITFSYEGYRITVEQNGRAKFVKLS